MVEHRIGSLLDCITRDKINAKTPSDWECIAMMYCDVAAFIVLVDKKDEKFGPIFDEIHRMAVCGFNSGNVFIATEMYAQDVIIVDMERNKEYYGVDQIINSVAHYITMGTIEMKIIRRIMHHAGPDRFSAWVEFETTILATGNVIRGFFQQLYDKQGDQWKCVFERNGSIDPVTANIKQVSWNQL
ncbi:hypothetical protein PRIPAC_97755 [Pristionchus pacificus]|uniref:Uncharacterized protein n=1 Tax=Pristionchus pacificus TaxID=54126 RepID=A0A2A6D2D7_PRIPA|nr:hypothetical protein PRIPAC_97755 [Pristionchus pacificus]|eukprot:PDM84575.1 hypothetical protein PRIPAC_33598 [Pristionchus pacificus]